MNRDWSLEAGVLAGAAERVQTGFAAGVLTGTEDSSQEFYQNIDGILFLIRNDKENKETGTICFEVRMSLKNQKFVIQ